MQVRILYFGALKEAFPTGEELLELPPGSTSQVVLDRCRDRAPATQWRLWPNLAVAINRQYASRNQELHEGDEIALLPPVSGGSNAGPRRSGRVSLVREPIDTAAISGAIKQAADGAIALFDGIVRDNSRGRRTLYLDYEAYEPMALDMLRSLAAEAVDQWGVREVSILHRLGRLAVGETSVFIAVAAAHRAQALDACRWLIDTLKTTVPIWKKEYFEDGAVWAAGEPFPDAIRSGASAVTPAASPGAHR